MPLNLIADFGGGAMQLAVGVLAATLHARASGRGQVVATSILEGTLALTAMAHGMRAGAAWTDAQHDNVLDGGAPFYCRYRTRGDGHVAVAAIETKFYRALLQGLSLEGELEPSAQVEKASWPATHARLETAFLSRTRDEWAAHSGTGACVTPVLTFAEALLHPQNADAFVETPGGWPAPRTFPRFSDSA